VDQGGFRKFFQWNMVQMVDSEVCGMIRTHSALVVAKRDFVHIAMAAVSA
jgi:hypothetical protein